MPSPLKYIVRRRSANDSLGHISLGNNELRFPPAGTLIRMRTFSCESTLAVSASDPAIVVRPVAGETGKFVMFRPALAIFPLPPTTSEAALGLIIWSTGWVVVFVG